MSMAMSTAMSDDTRRRLLLVVAATVLVQGVVAATSPRAAADYEPPAEPTLSAAVTAAGGLTRTYSWSVEKVADATVRSTLANRTATFGYTVTARAGGLTESAWALGGTVTVTGSDADGATTADVAVSSTTGGGSTCAVTGGDDVVVPPSGQVELPYTCLFTSAPGDGTVTATVTWDPVGEATTAAADASAPVSFAVASETNKDVVVVDDQTVPGRRVVLDPSLTWAPGLVRTYTYDVALAGGAAPGSCVVHTNTATIDQASGTDPTASASVRACSPEVLPAQAFGRATGSVTASCRGTVRVRVRNRTAETAVYRLRVGDEVRRISVRSLAHKKLVTRGEALATVTLKVGSTRLDRIRIPQRCGAPVALPDTGLRAASS